MSIIDVLSADRPVRSGSRETSPAHEPSRDQQDDPGWRESLDRSLSRAEQRESQESSRSATRDDAPAAESSERSASRAEKTTGPQPNEPSAAQETSAASGEHASSEDSADAIPQPGSPEAGTTQQSTAPDNQPVSGVGTGTESELTLLLGVPENPETPQGGESQPPTGLKQLLDNVQITRPTDAAGQQSNGQSSEEDAGVRQPPPGLMQALQTGVRQAAQSQTQQASAAESGTVVVDAAGADPPQQQPTIPASDLSPITTAESGEGEVATTPTPEGTAHSPQTQAAVQSLAGNAGVSANSREPDSSGQVARHIAEPSAEAVQSSSGQTAPAGRDAVPAVKTQVDAQPTAPEPPSDQNQQSAFGPSPTAKQASASTRPAGGLSEAQPGSDGDAVKADAPELNSGRAIRSETSGEIHTGTSSRPVTDVTTRPVAGEGTGNGDSGQITDQVARGIATATRERGPLRIRLNPPELGTLEIEVSNRNGGIAARLNVQSPTAHKAILDNLSQLSDALSQQGHSVNRIDVQLQPESAENDQPGQERENGSYGEQQQEQGSRDSSSDQPQQEQPHGEGDTEIDGTETPQPDAPRSVRLDQLDIAL